MTPRAEHFKAAVLKSRGLSYLHKKIRLVVVFALLMGITVVQEGHTESESLREYEIKAAFLYSFAKFIEWPGGAFENSQSSIIIGILGEDPFGSTLFQLEGKVIKGRSIVARKYVGTECFDELKQCHIVFVCSSEKERFEEIIETLRDTPALTVGETEGFARKGGVINFIIDNNKVRFEINVAAAERAGLKISSKLLQLARIVTEEQHTEGN